MSFNMKQNNQKAIETTKSSGKRPHNTDREAYTPEIDEFQENVGSILESQVNAFHDEYLPTLRGSEYNKDLWRKVENRLFNLPVSTSELGLWHCTLVGYPHYEIFTLERTSRVSHTTGELTRASYSAVVLTDGVPKYFISAFLNSTWKGNITVIPIDERGPRYKDTYRINIVR